MDVVFVWDQYIRLDDCNSVYVGVSQALLSHIQLVQRAAADSSQSLINATTFPQFWLVYASCTL